MRMTSTGQVTIPQEIREELGLSTETEIDFEVERDAVRIVKVGAPRVGLSIVERLRGTADVKMTTDEILALTRG